MIRIIMIIELINAVTGIYANVLSFYDLQLFGLATVYWNGISYSLFFGGFLAIFLSENKIKAEIETKVYDRIKKDIEIVKTTKLPKGSLNNVTTQDRVLIMSWALEMIYTHGHSDLEGLLADRASGVPLNKLMSGNCSKCKSPTPRNQRSKD